ncbi:MAG: 50S ribosomal protein L11 methyltransferase [Myxococcota bacterium]
MPDGPLARELLVDVPAEREDAAVAAVYALGVMGVQLRDAETGAPPGRAQVLAWLPPTEATVAAAQALAAALGPTTSVSWRDVPVTWDLGPTVSPVGRRFAVVAPGAEAPTDRVPLVLEAALAFGDGLHPTTAGCVAALEENVHVGATVLDVGTGTGILALVAERLGAGGVVACDVDPLAVWTARRTMAANHADVDVVDALPDGRFGLVVANLYLEPLLALVPALAERVAAGGTLLVSGFTEGAAETVIAALRSAGLRPDRLDLVDGWVVMRARP